MLFRCFLPSSCPGSIRVQRINFCAIAFHGTYLRIRRALTMDADSYRFAASHGAGVVSESHSLCGRARESFTSYLELYCRAWAPSLAYYWSVFFVFRLGFTLSLRCTSDAFHLWQVRNAARVIGDPTLYRKMETTSQLIKRDIVFAASLYVT